ncbi:MAG: aspartate carbamoyltransferase [Nanobdellota archaeon]
METKEISPYKHIIESQQFDKEFLMKLFDKARYMKDNEKMNLDDLKGKIVAMLFYEPSTRTRFSFESAVSRLGGEKITTENAKEFSSVSKGETLQDTIKIISGYVDYIVIRHSDDDSAEKAAKVSSVPIINAGAGKGQHPTQALLDVYTIYEKFGRLENLEICLAGDLLRGRTVNSLVYLMSKFKGNKFYFVSPENSKAKKGIKEYLEKHGIKYEEYNELYNVLPKADIIYMTRVQKERFTSAEEYKKVKGKIKIDTHNIENMKKTSVIMHPLPRVDEISEEIDNDERSIYFEQAVNGKYIRMALLSIMDGFNKRG